VACGSQGPQVSTNAISGQTAGLRLSDWRVLGTHVSNGKLSLGCRRLRRKTSDNSTLLLHIGNRRATMVREKSLQPR
jgi:hypothetical protein